MSFFRYPGGKTKLHATITAGVKALATVQGREYREPFFGGGAGLAVLRGVPTIRHLWLNDLDAGIACLWTAVIRCPQPLMDRIERFVPSVGAFDDYRAELLSAREMPVTDKEVARIGFMKLAIHQMSYSGLGTMSGGPLGGRGMGNIAGKTQEGRCLIDGRWSPGYINKKINRLHALLRVFSIREDRCTCLDFAEVIGDAERDAILYLDPPYYVNGPALYQHGFTVADHERLAGLLRSCPHPWVLSYDDSPEIRRLYEGARAREVRVSYSIAAPRDKGTGKRRPDAKTELLIFGGHAISDLEGLRKFATGERVRVATPLAAHGEIGRGRGGDRGDNGTSKRGSNSAAYLTSKLKRDAPEIAARALAGEFKSVRQAALAAGIARETPPLVIAQRAWKRMSADERAQFICWIDSGVRSLDGDKDGVPCEKPFR